MDPSHIIACLAERLQTNLTITPPTSVTLREREIANYFSDTLYSLVDSKRCHYEEEVTLDRSDEDYGDDDDDDCDLDSESGSGDEDANVYSNQNNFEADDEGEDKNNTIGSYHLTEYSEEYMQQVVDYAYHQNYNGSKRRRSWRSVHHRFKALPDQAYVSRFRKYLAQGGTKRQKIHNVNEAVYRRFIVAREKCLPVHDIDLQRIALQVSHELNLENFVASCHWLSNFKARHSIVCRRITNIVTHHEIENFDEIQKSEDAFVKEFFALSPRYQANEIVNTDQVGIEREVRSTRTLSFLGEKKTFGAVGSKNACTHSYTIQPMISLDGELVGPMFLCLQEPTGRMGDIVKANLFEPANVVITCSSSGKLTSSLVLYWRDHCLVPSIGTKALLLSDSWSGQNDASIYDELKCLIQCTSTFEAGFACVRV